MLRILLVICFVLPFDVIAQQVKKGQNEVTVEGILTSLTTGYSSQYRPPSPTGNSTQVKIGLRSFRLLQFDPSSSELTLTFNTFQEYNDTRLKFANNKVGVNFVQLPVSSKYNLWRAKLSYPTSIPVENSHGVIVDHETTSNTLLPKATFVSPGGNVGLRTDLGERQLILRGNMTRNGTKFTLEIVAKQRLSEVALVWNEKKPVTFEKHGENVSVFSDDLPRDYSLKNMTQGVCKSEEDFGSFGTFQYSCLKVEFLLEKANNNNTMSMMMGPSTPGYPYNNYYNPNNSVYSTPRYNMG